MNPSAFFAAVTFSWLRYLVGVGLVFGGMWLTFGRAVSGVVLIVAGVLLLAGVAGGPSKRPG